MERLYPLVDAFRKDGFNKDHPALVGYVLNGRIQLLSGTHRHCSAQAIGMKIPVTLWLGSQIDQSWGTLEEWAKIMKDIPVKRLEQVDVEDFRQRGTAALTG
jgi:hypothetical protein